MAAKIVRGSSGNLSDNRLNGRNRIRQTTSKDVYNGKNEDTKAGKHV